MKKSKVIIPAMALLLFSTAASVTGTVAWFSSTRVFNTSAASFGVKAIDGNLEATCTGRVGTTATTGSKGVQANTNARLTHGSFNHTTTEAWILNNEPSGNNTDTFKSRGLEATAFGKEKTTAKTSDWFIKTADSNDYYVAFSWQIDFTYTFGGGEQNAVIFLDRKNTTLSVTKGANGASSAGSTRETNKGFRIAFYPVTVSGGTETVASGGNGVARVWSNNGAYDAAHYVTGSSSINDQGTYTANNYVTSQDTSRYAENLGSATVDAYAEKICSVSSAATTVRVICVAWYEGTEDNVKSDASMDDVTANLVFYARSVTTGSGS